MSEIVELAKEIKKRDNRKRIGVQIGTVKAVSPILITIDEGRIILDGESCAVCQWLKDREEVVTISGLGEKTIEHKNVLNAGDKVVCIPTDDEQYWIVVDKVVK